MISQNRIYDIKNADFIVKRRLINKCLVAYSVIMTSLCSKETDMNIKEDGWIDLNLVFSECIKNR